MKQDINEPNKRRKKKRNPYKAGGPLRTVKKKK